MSDDGDAIDQQTAEAQAVTVGNWAGYLENERRVTRMQRVRQSMWRTMRKACALDLTLGWGFRRDVANSRAFVVMFGFAERALRVLIGAVRMPWKCPAYVVLTVLAVSTLLVVRSPEANAETVDGPLGPFAASSTVDVVGDRCGLVDYEWRGYAAPSDADSFDWLGNYSATIYRGAPIGSPYVYGPSVVDSASGTWPHVTGVDDFPDLRGSFKVCAKADSTQALTVSARWDNPEYGDSGFAEESVNYVVDYHPVSVKLNRGAHVVRVKVRMDGAPMSRVQVYVDARFDGTSYVLRKLRTNGAGVAKLKVTPGLKGERVKFSVSDFASTKYIRL